MEKFTKGSWVAVTRDKDVKKAVIYMDGGGFDISSCPDCIANAYLIAAAPEMYEMLKDCLAILTDGGFYTKAGKIDKLLKEARGEQ